MFFKRYVIYIFHHYYYYYYIIKDEFEFNDQEYLCVDFRVKSQQSNHDIQEATWELEEEMREKHHHLFRDSGMLSLED